MKKKIKANQGDPLFVITEKSRDKGGYPIARTDGGVICFFSHKRERIVPGEQWLVEVERVKDNVIIVKPIECTICAFEYERNLMTKLRGKYKSKPHKKKRPVASYPNIEKRGGAFNN